VTKLKLESTFDYSTTLSPVMI